MPSFDFPHGTPGERFSHLDLDRTVIAIPLLKQIQEELRIIEEFNLRFPEAARSHNVAILLSPRDPAGLEAAQARITEMAARAASLALKASTERLKRASAESRSAERKYIGLCKQRSRTKRSASGSRISLVFSAWRASTQP